MFDPTISVADGSTALETWGTRPLSEEELNEILQRIDELPADWDNPFVEEVRAVRQRHADQCDNDLDRICEDIRRNKIDRE